MASRLKILSLIVIGFFLLFTLVYSVKIFNISLPIPGLEQKPNLHNLTTFKSNQWYSSVYTFPSQPLYAFPLAFRLSERGIGFSYPDVVPTSNSVFASYNEDFSVGLESSFVKSSLEKVSDWSIELALQTTSNKRLHAMLGHGIPFTTIHTTDNHLILSSTSPFQIYPDNQVAPTNQPTLSNQFILEIKNHDYLVAFPQNTSVRRDNTIITANANTVFVALLPDRKHYYDFLAIASTEISATKATFAIQNQSLLTTYSLQTNGTKPLIALFPHQYDFLIDKPPSLGIYKTLRGDMHLVAASTFTTALPVETPPVTFAPNQAFQFIEQVKQDTQTILAQNPPGSQDYYLGVYFGKVATLMQLADAANLPAEKKQLAAYLKPLFLQSLDYFSYDKTQTSLIAKNSEFGNDKLNDHHFHYGYYIRTAAILGQDDPSFVQQVTPTIAQMIRDIATTDRDSSTYPFLRNFDVYEGHSWADGHALFTDGNNQESTPEALNAWYALYLWGQTTKNQTLQNEAMYLFTTELTSVKYYWFDQTHIYQPPYEHQLASIVWGGKVDFGTWFSSQTNMIYGIQLLPFTPASVYLKKIAPFEPYEQDYLTHGGNYTADWGELMLQWKALLERNSRLFVPRVSGYYEASLPATYSYFLLQDSK